MANQLHIIHSTNIMGAGILAAGPYHCAGSSQDAHCSLWSPWPPLYAWMWPHDTCQAMHVCSNFAQNTFAKFAFGWLNYYWGPPHHEKSLESTEKEARNGTIDPISGLKGDRVWLFTGKSDRMMPQGVVDQLRQYYTALFARPDVQNNLQDSLVYIEECNVDHSMVINVPGQPNRCVKFGQPFINDCDFDAAGRMMTFIYGLNSVARAGGGCPAETGLGRPEYGDWKPSNLFEFDQTEFFEENDDSVSMHAKGHVYVPEECKNGASCRLHVALHGCEQHQEAVEEAGCVKDAKDEECPALFFFKDAGYNEWAEKNSIVVLYPQNKPWGEPTDADPSKNAYGCWDWWGYSGENYFRRSGKQIQAIARTINALVGENLLPLE